MPGKIGMFLAAVGAEESADAEVMIMGGGRRRQGWTGSRGCGTCIRYLILRARKM